jgi:hypothetical protein
VSRGGNGKTRGEVRKQTDVPLHLALPQHISLEEQVAIFLSKSVTGLLIQHVSEHFQHSNETISLYFFSIPFHFELC